MRPYLAYAALHLDVVRPRHSKGQSLLTPHDCIPSPCFPPLTVPLLLCPVPGRLSPAGCPACHTGTRTRAAAAARCVALCCLAATDPSVRMIS